MAADTFDEDLGGGRRSSTRKRLSGKKLVLFVILPVLLVIGAAAGLWFSGALSGLTSGEGKAASSEPAAAAAGGPITGGPIFWPAKPMELLVNLRTDSPRPSFLKLSVSLELERAEDGVKIADVMPRVTDTLQVYLRELRADQLQGSAGLLRVREELLARINAAVRPVRVKDVLFNEMLIQ
jgi:flagellar FliL protein